MIRSLRFPTPFTVIFIVILLSALATWLIPAGSYDTLVYDQEARGFVINSATGTRNLPATNETLNTLGIPVELEKFTAGNIKKPISVPGTYKPTEAEPAGLSDIIFAPIRGMYEAIDIILFVLIIGGFMGVFNRSGAFDEGIGYLANTLKGRESLLIILVTSLIAIGGTTFGLAEETLAFYPLLVPVFLAAGYDLLIPVAVIFIGSSIGTMGSTINPFATIVASDAAGINWTTGFYSRLAMLVAGTIISILYILRYARKIKRDPSLSMVYNPGKESPATAAADHTRHQAVATVNKVLLLLFALTFAVMIWGVSFRGWWFEEMTALFLVAAIIIGFLQRIGEHNFIEAFLAGARDLLGVSLIIGVARGVTFVLNEGQISDTLLFYAANLVEGMSGFLFLPALMFIYFVLTLFISSSSGLAVVTMPIMSSLSSLVGVPTEEIVNAYLFGFGLMTFITPTGLILPSLAMVNVKYNVWLKFIWPLLAILALVGICIMWVGLLL
ncbi:YfcC family protein [Cesiribacter sp. SM1]|uniref:YfcC family protein n=1 Tax=Cesiribacter sp. SM1 TaxID=2861196 RepID=UPI001CD5A29B|nr:YfcC family protein [Cesiribacter sp. SM1]